MDGVFKYAPDPCEDYYSVLGCDPQSSEEQILAEYRARAKELHPDKSGDTEEFQKIQTAKETLLDKAKRSLYDKWRSAGLAISFQQWTNMRDSIQGGMHWATPKLGDRMLPEGAAAAADGASAEGKGKAAAGAGKKTPLERQDSSHSTIVMVKACREEEIRRKFRNYEI